MGWKLFSSSGVRTPRYLWAQFRIGGETPFEVLESATARSLACWTSIVEIDGLGTQDSYSRIANMIRVSSMSGSTGELAISRSWLHYLRACCSSRAGGRGKVSLSLPPSSLSDVQKPSHCFVFVIHVIDEKQRRTRRSTLYLVTNQSINCFNYVGVE